MQTIRSVWYEAWIKHDDGKLANRFNGYHFDSLREVKKAIKESNAREKERGYKPTEYKIMVVDIITVRDENGVISETRTSARAY